MRKKYWKIGELSSATGVTVRTLHHYHEKGLLIPSEISEAGYRLYSKDDIIRLQQIVTLKRLSFGLDEIKILLERKDFDPIKIIENQLEIINEQINKHTKIKSQLETFSTILHYKNAKVKEFIKLIGVFTMDEITLEVGIQLVPLVDKEKGGELLESLAILRKQKDFPPVRIRDNTLLKENKYRFIMDGKEIFLGECNNADIFPKENIDNIIKKLEEIIGGKYD
jgi:DNA-binding transcriptional MerR regulator